MSATGFAAAPEAARPADERTYLNLEGVRGKSPSAVLNVILTLPGGDPDKAGPDATRTVAIFGLANATSAEGPHGGNGLSATVEVTDIARRLQAESPERIEAHVALPEGAGDNEVTVDRISIYVRHQS